MKHLFGRVTLPMRRAALIADFTRAAEHHRVKQMELEAAALRVVLDAAHFRELAEHYERQAKHLQAQVPGFAQHLADLALDDIIHTDPTRNQ